MWAAEGGLPILTVNWGLVQGLIPLNQASFYARMGRERRDARVRSFEMGEYQEA